MKTGRLNGTILPAGIGRSKKEGNVVNQEIIPAYSAYQKVIDLTLYHAFAELIVQMAQDDEVRILYRQQEVRQIWQRDQNVSGYLETYSLRYPGEVLERFEEKLGTDMRILRALALALGYTRQCQADTMFVGNQRTDFLQKLRRTAGTDVLSEMGFWRKGMVHPFLGRRGKTLSRQDRPGGADTAEAALYEHETGQPGVFNPDRRRLQRSGNYTDQFPLCVGRQNPGQDLLERDHRRKNRIGVLPNALKPIGWTVGRALCLCWMVVWPL